ncbi:glycosyltransferase family 2 protein [Bacteroidota bacterium]
MRHSVFDAMISEQPQKDLNYIVVIPVYYEPDVILSLESLYNCKPVESSVEVIIIINSSSNAEDYVKDQNRKTESHIHNWTKNHRNNKFRFHILHFPDLAKKYAGAGMARKIGMDIAISRFHSINNPEGIIISFDADSICDKNYFTEIDRIFKNKPETNACTIYFEHPFEGELFDKDIYDGIIHYELYIRYYKQSLQYTGFPFAYYTIGSCFAVKAKVYVKQGGMNRKKAGEDFYFLNKVFPKGNIIELNSTRVIPSPRPSKRVPFGTGPEIEKWIKEKKLNVYNFQAFKDLSAFLQKYEIFRQITDKEEHIKEVSALPDAIGQFLVKNDFYSEINIIKADCKTVSSFEKRFFQWFDSFKVIKYLNFAHDNYYSKTPVCLAAIEFLEHVGVEKPIKADALYLLKIFRKLEP